MEQTKILKVGDFVTLNEEKRAIFQNYLNYNDNKEYFEKGYKKKYKITDISRTYDGTSIFNLDNKGFNFYENEVLLVQNEIKFEEYKKCKEDYV